MNEKKYSCVRLQLNRFNTQQRSELRNIPEIPHLITSLIDNEKRELTSHAEKKFGTNLRSIFKCNHPPNMGNPTCSAICLRTMEKNLKVAEPNTAHAR